MSDGINEVHIKGNAGRDAELRYLASGVANASFSVALSRWVRDANAPGRGTEYTDWITVVAWDELAENASGVVVKGETVEVWGRLSSRSYDDAQGIRRYRTDVVASRIVAGGEEVPSRRRGASRPQASRPAPGPRRTGDEAMDDDGPMYETATGRPARGGEVDPDDLPF